MAVDTNNEKLALIHFHQPYQPSVPLPAGTLDQADNQQLLWDYPGVLWAEPEVQLLHYYVVAAGVFLPGGEQASAFLPGADEADAL